jgi:hypothetical protein
MRAGVHQQAPLYAGEHFLSANAGQLTGIKVQHRAGTDTIPATLKRDSAYEFITTQLYFSDADLVGRDGVFDRAEHNARVVS